MRQGCNKKQRLYHYSFQGDNAMIGLSILGHEDTFEISPKVIHRRGQFVISVKNSKKLDFEKTKKFNFKVL